MEAPDLYPSRLPLIPAAYSFWCENCPKYSRAYDLTLRAELRAAEQAKADPTSQNAQDNMVFARVAGYLLIELFDRRTTLGEEPCETLHKSLLQEVCEPAEDEDDIVFGVGRWCCYQFLQLFRQSSERRYNFVECSGHPPPSSRPSFDTKESMIKEYIAADGNDYHTAKRKALARDGFRCVLTGSFDKASVANNHELKIQCVELAAEATPVKACHIIGKPVLQCIGPSGECEADTMTRETDFSTAPAVSVLSGFGFDDLIERLALRDGINNLGNMLSLDLNCRSHFDDLDLWFEKTAKPDCYVVCVSDSSYAVCIRNHGHLKPDHLGRPCVTFSQSDKSLPLPDPQLLAIHAACARVTCMSGVAKVLDRDDEETEENLNIEETREDLNIEETRVLSKL